MDADIKHNTLTTVPLTISSITYQVSGIAFHVGSCNGFEKYLTDMIGTRAGKNLRL